MDPTIDRRAFLALGLGALAWACARPRDDAADDGTDDPAATGGAAATSIVLTAPMGLAVGDTRQGFAILRGQKPITPQDVKVRVSAPGGEPFEVKVSKVEIVLGPGGHDGHDHTHPPGSEVTHIYTFRHDFDRAGIWEVAVSFDGGEGNAQFQLAEKSAAPAVGDEALATDSPTADNARGVDPICTRDPVCNMHDMTIADAIEAGKPAVIVFATPRFCTSRTCGPVVDFVQQIKGEYSDEVSFVHIEVWKDDEDSVGKPGGESGAFAEWKLATEPWIYFVDGKGVVRDRWMGATGLTELETAVEALLD